MKKNHHKLAFSLIELSIVILIIGILVAGVTQSSRLVRQMRLSTARSITTSSPVNSIKDLVAWYESTSEKSFLEGEADNQALLRNWFDLNIQSSVKDDAYQTVDANKPQYGFDEQTGLPVVKFINQDFFNMPDGTIPFNNSPYTIFFVARTEAFCQCGVMGSGTYGGNNQTNSFRYDPTGGVFNNYWWFVDLVINGATVVKKMQIFSFTYNLSTREGFVDGVSKGSVASSNRASTAINNTIGVTYSTEYMNGQIGEIIIFDRALKTEERKSIEQYLGKKWSIKVS